MFEKFSESARRCVFFARYEAARFGSAQIEIEHLLLGILRIDSALAMRLLGSPERLDAIRDQIEKQLPAPQKGVSTSADLPVSQACRSALDFAAKESEALQHKLIGPEHLLLGISRDESSTAGRTLGENGLAHPQLREKIVSMARDAVTPQPVEPSAMVEDARDLTASTELGPLIGRERELDRIIQILARRTRNNPVLIGEPGVGKTAIVEGLARRIRDGMVPAWLADSRILTIDAASLVAPRRRTVLANLTHDRTTILCVEGLFNLGAEDAGWHSIEAAHVLEPYLARGDIRAIATGTPSGLRHTAEKAAILVRHFEVVEVPPPDEAEAVRILLGLKEQYQKFHNVIFGEGAIETAVYASGRFLFHRHLPDRALDLIDEAGARARLRAESEPAEIRQARGRIRMLIRNMESAIGTHQFDKARKYSEEERKERENVRRLSEALKPKDAAGPTITPDDIVQVIAERSGMPMADVKGVLEQKTMGRWERITKELMAVIPAPGNSWTPFLAAYLSRCPAEEAEKLAQAIRDVVK